MSESSIGIFDSGIGGLTVAREIHARYPGEGLVYLGDTARLPYGSKSPDTIVRYAVQNVAFLAQHPLKAIVVACNTVSAVALPALRAGTDIPVLGVIQPGARTALAATRNNHIGVIGQPGTINSARYEAEIMAGNPEARVYSRATPLLVPLAEEGWVGSDVARGVLIHYLEPLMATPMDTLVLGCTHYPLFRTQIQHLMETHFQRTVTLVDSAVSVADELGALLADHCGGSRQSPPHQFFATDDPASFTEVGRRFWGQGFPPVVHVDL